MDAHRLLLPVRDSVVAAGLACAALSLGACTSSGQPQSAADVEKNQPEVVMRLDQSTQLVGHFRPQIPDDLARRARCLVVVPGLKKGGLILGGEGGKGFATCASGGAWSSPAPITMTGGTLGAQIGYESADVVALVVSDSAEKALEAGNFKIGVNASAAAGPLSSSASRAGDVGVKSDILSYSESRGLFAGATLNGMTVSSDDEAIRALYGTNPDLASILERRAKLPRLASVQRFLGEVTDAFAPAVVGVAREGAERAAE